MTLTNVLRVAGFSTLLFAFAGLAAAQGQQYDTNTTTSALAMSAEVQTSIQLNLSGTAVTGSNGAFAIDFGSVNGLGLGTPATGVSVVSDGTGATYSSPINLTPIFTGFVSETASVEVVSTGTDEAIALEGALATNMTSASTERASITGVASGSLNARFVGFRIARTEAAGPKDAVLTFTVTMDVD